LYGEIQQVVWNDVASVFLWSIVAPLVTDARIEGVDVLAFLSDGIHCGASLLRSFHTPTSRAGG
jgi:hypothetical protein